jgi:multidrug efflux system membrane fusion protein
VVIVPAQAVQIGQNGPYVFVIKPDRTAEYRQVKVARTIGMESVIAEGLTAGEQIVVDGQLRLTNGIRVEPRAMSGGTQAIAGAT